MERFNMWHHWAYRPENEGELARIRRAIEESNDPADWETVSERTDGKDWKLRIVKYAAPVYTHGKQYQVLFLEAWYYRGEQIFRVNNLFMDMWEAVA